MKEGRPSFSAEVMALYRAAESAKPEAERLYSDVLAKGLLGTPLRLLARSRLLTNWAIWFFGERRAPGSVGIVLARSRYIDDCLRECLAEGIEQLVILGAGYDSRAYRFEALKGKVKVFEVDHHATQNAKLRRLTSLLGSLPGHVRFVAVDFARDDPAGRLLESGYNRDLKTLFIWEGVSYYLSPEAVDKILNFVFGYSPRGSSLVFDYFVQMSEDEAAESGTSVKKLDRIAQSAKWQGEPVLFRMRPEWLREFLFSRGFHMRANVTAQDLKRLYCRQNRPGKLSPHLAIARATVS